MKIFYKLAKYSFLRGTLVILDLGMTLVNYTITKDICPRDLGMSLENYIHNEGHLSTGPGHVSVYTESLFLGFLKRT